MLSRDRAKVFIGIMAVVWIIQPIARGEPFFAGLLRFLNTVHGLTLVLLGIGMWVVSKRS